MMYMGNLITVLNTLGLNTPFKRLGFIVFFIVVLYIGSKIAVSFLY